MKKEQDNNLIDYNKTYNEIYVYYTVCNSFFSDSVTDTKIWIIDLCILI